MYAWIKHSGPCRWIGRLIATTSHNVKLLLIKLYFLASFRRLVRPMLRFSQALQSMAGSGWRQPASEAGHALLSIKLTVKRRNPDPKILIDKGHPLPTSIRFHRHMKRKYANPLRLVCTGLGLYIDTAYFSSSYSSRPCQTDTPAVVAPTPALQQPDSTSTGANNGTGVDLASPQPAKLDPKLNAVSGEPSTDDAGKVAIGANGDW